MEVPSAQGVTPSNATYQDSKSMQEPENKVQLGSGAPVMPCHLSVQARLLTDQVDGLPSLL